jgi:hypothetical protein
MRGDLDETLARLARREEALRRRSGGPGDDPGPADRERAEPRAGEVPGAADAPHAGEQPPSVAVPHEESPRAGHGAYRLRGGSRGVDRDPVEEVAEAVRRVVAGYPGLAVTLRVEVDGQAYPLRVSWAGPAVTVGAEVAAVAPPAWPMPVRPVPARTSGQDGPDGDPAARLAELIRRDPSLLEDTGPLP